MLRAPENSTPATASSPVLVVAVAVLAATAGGILCERRYTTARTIAR
jgi:hypothetical protein